MQSLPNSLPDSLNDSSTYTSLNNSNNEETAIAREMSDERYFYLYFDLNRFQELLDESRKWKSEWIDLGREEAEVNLWTLLRKESNILKLTNQLHPNQNQ